MAFFSVKKDAAFAFGARYRLWLSREWDAALPKAMFIMLNPSTADCLVDDPTIRKCMGFARRWGLGGVVVVNLFDLRTPKPSVLLKAVDPCSLFADLNIREHLTRAHKDRWTVVCAWGNHGWYKDRCVEVCEMISVSGVIPYALGDMTKEHSPPHPLYISYETKLKRMALA